MAKGDATPPQKEARDVAPVKDSTSQVSVSFEDMKDYASAAVESLGKAADAGVQFLGRLDLFDSAPAKPTDTAATGGELGVNPGGAIHGDRQGKPPIDFDPSAGGGCFGDIPTPEGVHTDLGGKINPAINDWIKHDNSDKGDLSKRTSEVSDDLLRSRPEVEKRARFESAMKDMAKAFPDSFQASQELMQAAFRAAQTGDLDVNQMRDLAQRAAKEFAEDPSGEAAQRMRAISDQLQKDYGINVSIGKKGLEIRNQAEGAEASMVRFDQHGNVTAKVNVGPGGSPEAVSAEEALGNIAETRRQHVFDNVRSDLVGKLETVGDRLKNPSESSPMRKPIPKDVPIKVYEQALQDAMRQGTPVVVNVGR
jgi:hypothetical protein